MGGWVDFECRNLIPNLVQAEAELGNNEIIIINLVGVSMECGWGGLDQAGIRAIQLLIWLKLKLKLSI